MKVESLWDHAKNALNFATNFMECGLVFRLIIVDMSCSSSTKVSEKGGRGTQNEARLLAVRKNQC